MKTCSHCKVAKPLDCFFKHRRTKDGLSFLCKDCFRERHKSGAWKKTRNPEKENIARGARYHTVTGDVVRARNRASYQKFKEKRRLSRQAAYAKNLPTNMLCRSRNRAVEIGVPFDLTRADIVIPETCPVLGIPISTTARGRQNDNSPSIDRIDNSLGYTRENIKVVSWRANRLKSDGHIEDFEKILKYMRSNIKIERGAA
jgi:predicted Fe-S protein YdhL (DUF1289 family)